MTQPINATDHAARRARIESALAAYPSISDEELADLLQWFRNEASALDVGVIASTPRLAQPYQRFKAEHLDRLRGADLMRAAVFLMMIGAGIAAVIWTVT